MHLIVQIQDRKWLEKGFEHPCDGFVYRPAADSAPERWVCLARFDHAPNVRLGLGLGAKISGRFITVLHPYPFNFAKPNDASINHIDFKLLNF